MQKTWEYSENSWEKIVSQNHGENYRAPVGYKEFLRVNYVIRTNCVLVSVLDFKVKTPTIGLELVIRGREGKITSPA
jgi:hypothetical protein